MIVVICFKSLKA